MLRPHQLTEDEAASWRVDRNLVDVRFLEKYPAPFQVNDGEVWVYNIHIKPYSHRGYADHEPTRKRKLLLHRQEIRKLIGRTVERGMTLVEVPDEEFDTMGTNVLAIAPRRCVIVTGNPVTRRRLEQAGADVVEYEGSEISLKGGGGPTCLTRPLQRLSVD